MVNDFNFSLDFFPPDTSERRDELIRQVIQGGGNMPAYGKHLSPSEVTALVSFLMTLHPEWEHEPGAEESNVPRPTTGP